MSEQYGSDWDNDVAREVLKQRKPHDPTSCIASYLASEAAEKALAEALPDALSSLTEGGDYLEAPEPSDEPGSRYVTELAAAILASWRQAIEGEKL